MIELRLDDVKQLKNKFKSLSKSEAVSSINRLLNRLVFDDQERKATREKDFSHAEREEVIRWLRTLNIQNQIVNVYWVSLKEGIQLDFQDFSLNHDELWLPGADDLLVENTECTWILEMHHEEIFSFYRVE